MDWTSAHVTIQPLWTAIFVLNRENSDIRRKSFVIMGLSWSFQVKIKSTLINRMKTYFDRDTLSYWNMWQTCPFLVGRKKEKTIEMAVVTFGFQKIGSNVRVHFERGEGLRLAAGSG